MPRSTTTNLHLIKPEYTEYGDVADLNANMETIDAAYKDMADDIDALETAAGSMANDIDALETASSGYLTKAAQSLTSEEQTQVKSNIGVNVANNLTTTNAGYMLDARQGKALKDKLDVIGVTNWSGIIGTDDQSVTNNTNKKLGNLDLTPGSYILTFTIEWSSNSSGLRTMWIAENSDTTSSLGIGCTNTVAAVPGNATRQQVTVPYYTNANKTLYVCCNQNSGSTLTAKARYGKARIS